MEWELTALVYWTYVSSVVQMVGSSCQELYDALFLMVKDLDAIRVEVHSCVETVEV